MTRFLLKHAPFSQRIFSPGGGMAFPRPCPSHRLPLIPVLLLALAANTFAQSAIPAAAQLAKLREAIALDPRAAEMGKKVCQEADLALQRPAQPLRAIIYEGRLDNDPERVNTVRNLADMERLEVLAQAWALTGQPKYADKARDLIKAWTAKYAPTGNPINENKLEPLLVCYAIHRASFPPAEQQRIDHWLRQLAEAEQKHALQRPDTTQNNWHPKRLKLVAFAGTILQDSKLLDYAIEGAKAYVDTSLRSNGASVDFEQRDALSYHIGGVKPLMGLSAILLPTGFDFYHYVAPGGGSVQKSVAFVLPYAEGTQSHGEFAHTTAEIDKKRAAAGLAKYQPGRRFEPVESLALFEMASAFEPKYGALVAKLSQHPGAQFPTWAMVLAKSGWVFE